MARYNETRSYRNRPGQGRKPFTIHVTPLELGQLCDEFRHGVLQQDGVTRRPVNFYFTNWPLAQGILKRVGVSVRTLRNHMFKRCPDVRSFRQVSVPRLTPDQKKDRVRISCKWIKASLVNPLWCMQVLIIDQVKSYGSDLMNGKMRMLLSIVDECFGLFREYTVPKGAEGLGCRAAYEINGMVCAGFKQQVPLMFGSGTTGQTPSKIYKVRAAR